MRYHRFQRLAIFVLTNFINNISNDVARLLAPAKRMLACCFYQVGSSEMNVPMYCYAIITNVAMKIPENIICKVKNRKKNVFKEKNFIKIFSKPRIMMYFDVLITNMVKKI